MVTRQTFSFYWKNIDLDLLTRVFIRAEEREEELSDVYEIH